MSDKNFSEKNLIICTADETSVINTLLDKTADCCFTGHRFISKSHISELESKLIELITELSKNGVTNFICGGALGFDTLAAKSVIKCRESNPDIKLVLALPCQNHFINWHKQYIDEFDEIFKDSDIIIYVSDEYYDGCMQKRNRFMVEKSQHCIFYMTTPRGGTAYTVRYALQSELDMHNIMTFQQIQ